MDQPQPNTLFSFSVSARLQTLVLRAGRRLRNGITARHRMHMNCFRAVVCVFLDHRRTCAWLDYMRTTRTRKRLHAALRYARYTAAAYYVQFSYVYTAHTDTHTEHNVHAHSVCARSVYNSCDPHASQLLDSTRLYIFYALHACVCNRNQNTRFACAHILKHATYKTSFYTVQHTLAFSRD